MSTVSDDQISAVFDEVQALLIEMSPEGDWYSEPLSSLMVLAESIFYAWVDARIDEMGYAMSIEDIIENPTAVSSDLLDIIAANYGLERRVGTVSTGSVTVVLDNFETTVIPENTQFESATGNLYETTETQVGVTTASLVTADNTQLIRTVSGQRVMTVTVEALEEGEDSTLKKLSALNIVGSVPNVDYGYAAADFTAGTDGESNESLIARIQAAASQPVNDSATHIDALLTRQFSYIRDVQTIGFGDTEMTRDRGNLLGVSTGGRVDVYIRTAELPETESVSFLAELQNATTGEWSFDIEEDIFPAFYTVEEIITEDGVSIGDYDTEWFLNDPPSSIEFPLPTDARFTAYQAARVTFTDKTLAIGKTAGDTIDITVALKGLPNMQDVNDYIISDAVRNPAGDYLVKAAVPCFLSFEVTIEKTTQATVSQSEVKAAVAQVVNAESFNLPFHLSKVVEAIQDSIPSSASLILPLLCRYIYWTADGASSHVTFDEIDIPTSSWTSNNTIALYCHPDDISVTVVSR